MPPPTKRKNVKKYKISFLLKNSLSLENFGASLSSIKSLKKLPARIYKSVAPILVEKRTINIPHHFPNINPPNKRSGDAKPKKRTHTIEK